MTNNQQHVVQTDNGWGVRKAGSKRLTQTFNTQKQAIGRAREIAINQRGEVKIHGVNGRIRESNSYGNDPFPPKG